MRLVKTKENACLYTNRTVIYVSATRDSPENNAKNITVSSEKFANHIDRILYEKHNKQANSRGAKRQQIPKLKILPTMLSAR